MILIVDDDVPLGTALERMLRFAGLDAVAIGSASEALSLLKLRKPQLIVLDLQLPHMDGMTLLRAIRHDVSCKNVPIIIYTADFSQLAESRAIAAGAQAYVVKGTVGWEALLARIQELIADDKPHLRVAY